MVVTVPLWIGSTFMGLKICQNTKNKKTVTTYMLFLQFQIRAEDKDSGRNGKVKYSFAPGMSSRVLQMFTLHEETGDMVLLQSVESSGKSSICDKLVVDRISLKFTFVNSICSKTVIDKYKLQLNFCDSC